MRRFDYFAPRTLEEAIDIFRRRGEGGRALAGGTDLIVQMKEGNTRFPPPSYLVSLRRIPELRGIRLQEEGELRLGSLVTMAELAASPLIRERFPIIAEGAAVVGSQQIMNMATVGGNLCNAAPSADTAPPLLACEAQAVIMGPDGQRTQPLEGFFLGPGQTVLGPGELLVEIRVPALPPRTGGAYARHTPRREMDIAVVGVAALVTLGEDATIQRARIALGAVAPTPMRAREAEAALEAQPPSDELFARAAHRAAEEARPISDLRASADFRRHLIRTLTERCLRRALARAGA